MLLSHTAYRAALFHLGINSIFVRASLTTTWALNRHPTQLPQAPGSRLYNVLFPQCALCHKLPELVRQAYTMSSPGDQSTSQTRENEDSPQSSEQPSWDQAQQEQLYLPDPESSSDGQQKPLRLDLGAEGGSTVTLDHLGPMVVNVDGTLSRIGNWDQMTEIERKNTLRILGKRNKQRLEALKAARGGEEQR